jgi:hypothetical protein
MGFNSAFKGLSNPHALKGYAAEPRVLQHSDEKLSGMLRRLAWQTFTVSKEFINLRLPSEAATEKYFHFAIVLTLVSKWDKQHDTPIANYCVHIMPIDLIQSQMNPLKPLILHFYKAYFNNYTVCYFPIYI